MRDKPVVLLVEDDPSQLVDYITKLEGSGFLVLSAASAEHGITLAQSHHIDAILTDNILPGMTGLRSIAEFAKHTRAPVFVMTSHYNAEVENDARLLGAKGCLKKPPDFAFLRQELHGTLTDSNDIKTPARPKTDI